MDLKGVTKMVDEKLIDTSADKLKLLLKDLFQFENNDLDFGIYRIINIKKKEISEFINKDLFEIINEKIKTVGDNSELKSNLEALKTVIESDFGCEILEAKQKYAEVPKVQSYLEKEKEMNLVDKENYIEEEIYDDIISFFSRYYDKGDFISKRRYSKDAKYAIPYNGEEVYLHWANNDQYYIKTGENFNNYSFKTNAIKVDFEVTSEEVDIEKNNIKDSEKKFFIFNEAEYDSRTKHLNVKFGYKGLTGEEEEIIKDLSGKKRLGKDEVNQYNLKQINEKIGIYGLADLQKKHIKMDGDKSEKSELEWHLNKYTTKNTSDYFIHKGLKKFLSQELDFYIKNEILHIDDIDSKEDLNINLKKIKVFKEISLKIIEFLAQIEEFQKKMWEKMKFVTSTDYCITLDYIDEKYYPEILKNEKQIEEWKQLYSFGIDVEVNNVKGNLTGTGKSDEGLKIEVLKQNPTLVIDTKFYDLDFKYQILSEIDNLDDKTTGILINSDNFHALNLLLNKYEKKIKCCYIDPPYNTKATPIIYKNEYKESSWLSLIENRLKVAIQFLEEEQGVFSIAIDDTELGKLTPLLELSLPNYEVQKSIVIHYPGSGTGRSNVTRTHEYNIFLIPKGEDILRGKEKEDGIRVRNFRRAGTGENNYRTGRPNSFYAVLVNPNNREIVAFEKPPQGKYPTNSTDEGYIRIYPIGSDDSERVWTLSYEGAIEAHKNSLLQCTDNMTINRLYNDEKARGLLDSIWSNTKFNATSQGTNLLTSIFGNSDLFSYPKSVYTTMTAIDSATFESENAIILDYFAGSGTTGHAVLKLNKEDNGNRKFILVEMGHYFETVTKPRILKVIYSDNWKDGKPQDNNGSKKQIIKYQTLEQYEDSLNNIDFKEPTTLAKESKDYNIKYMLEFESKGSNVFLNLDALDSPFEYKLKTYDNNEFREHNVDLIETFNYIAGIDVKSIQRKLDDNEVYIIVKGYRKDKAVIIIWRNRTDGFEPVRDKEFIENNILNEEYDEILINGNSLIKNAKSIDEIFKTNMFRG